MKPSPSCSQFSSTISDERSTIEYWFCTETTSTIARAISSSVRPTLQTPMWRILPSAFRSATAPTVSSYGSFGSTECSW